uniref:Uncharacterized protein n=1 Tax=Arion vulgaris TaxID=1028688 RepID=A0A0B6Y7Y8_9EUPU
MVKNHCKNIQIGSRMVLMTTRKLVSGIHVLNSFVINVKRHTTQLETGVGPPGLSMLSKVASNPSTVRLIFFCWSNNKNKPNYVRQNSITKKAG